jgi:hypothetical protein
MKTSKIVFATVVALLLSLAPLADSIARADDKPDSGARKSISFDDNVVEGMKNTKDSLETVGKKDGKDKNHLYKKRPDYKKELQSANHEMGETP